MRAPVADPELLLMFLADARLPTGGHTQSAGLEAALVCGALDRADLADYCRTRLATVTRVEAGTAVVCRALALRGAPTAAAEEAWAARTPSPAVRAASRTMGRAYRRLALRLWPGSTVDAELGPVAEPSRARVLGLVAAHLGLAADSLARLVAYDDLQTVLAASLKLVPADPAAVSATGLGLLAEVDDLVAAVAGLTEPDGIPAGSAPLLEQWCEDHARLDRRLFRA